MSGLFSIYVRSSRPSRLPSGTVLSVVRNKRFVDVLGSDLCPDRSQLMPASVNAISDEAIEAVADLVEQGRSVPAVVARALLKRLGKR